jgi:hypothetical protein
VIETIDLLYLETLLWTTGFINPVTSCDIYSREQYIWSGRSSTMPNSKNMERAVHEVRKVACNKHQE